jgi:enoyl-CoA hydratase
MVSKIFPPDELQDSAVAFARRIASIPTMAALLIKESVNQSVDQMGFYNALNACLSLHELNHAHWAWVHDNRMPMGCRGSGNQRLADQPAGAAGREEPRRHRVLGKYRVLGEYCGAGEIAG